MRNMLQLAELMSGCNGGDSPEASQQFSCRSFTFTDDLKRCFEPSLPGLRRIFSRQQWCHAMTQTNTVAWQSEGKCHVST